MELAWGLDSGPPFAPFVGAGALAATGAVTTDTGIIGCAAEFDGTTFVSVAASVALLPAVGTAYELWVNPAEVIGAYRFIAGQSDGGGGRALEIYQNGANIEAFLNSGAISAVAAGVLTAVTWQHVVVVIGAGPILNLYRNGVLIATSGVLGGPITVSAVPFSIGARDPAGAPSLYWLGLADEPRIWQFGVGGDPGAAFWLARYNGGAGQSDRGAVAPCP
jgi:hypothetical protein